MAQGAGSGAGGGFLYRLLCDRPPQWLETTKYTSRDSEGPLDSVREFSPRCFMMAQ